MRQVQPIRVVVPTLSRSGVGGETALAHRRRWRAQRVAPTTIPDHWNAADVRGLLYAVHGRACAYCGCHLPRNDRGDVDHFRPKGRVEGDPSHGGYWWLAYALGNLLLSCSLCNRCSKRSRFPLEPGSSHVRFSDRCRLATEARLLLNPLLDPVEEWLEVIWQEPLCGIRPRAGLQDREREMVRATLELFRVNSDPRLVRERRDVRDEVLTALRDRREEDVRRLAVRYRRHSLVAREILSAVRPALLPSPRQELDWLLRQLTRELLQALELLEDFPDDPRNRRETHEVLWALAILWKSPPAGRPDEVEEFLVREQLDRHVRAKVAELRAPPPAKEA